MAFLKESAREAYLKIHYDYDGIKRVSPLSVELSELTSFIVLKSAICSEIKCVGDMSAPIFAYCDEEGDYVDLTEKQYSRFIDAVHASDLKVTIKVFECILEKQMQAPSMHLSAANPPQLQTPPLKLPTIQTLLLNAPVLLTGMQLSSIQDEADILGNFVYRTPIEHSINNLSQGI